MMFLDVKWKFLELNVTINYFAVDKITQTFEMHCPRSREESNLGPSYKNVNVFISYSSLRHFRTASSFSLFGFYYMMKYLTK